MNLDAFDRAFRLDGEVAVVTGGATGIGKAIAIAMASAGARVVLVGRRRDALAAAVASLPNSAHFQVYDVGHYSEATSLFEHIKQAAGTPTCLVNNAGIHLKRPALETTPEDFEKILSTHVLGAHALVRAFAPTMIDRKAGSIIFTVSMASIFGIPQVIAYTAAKAALAGMVKGYATELSPSGVRVNAIAPGWIDTEMSRSALNNDPQRKRRIIERTPMARLGAPEDVGWAAVYLASRASRFVTGALLPVDGGVSVGF